MLDKRLRKESSVVGTGTKRYSVEAGLGNGSKGKSSCGLFLQRYAKNSFYIFKGVLKIIRKVGLGSIELSGRALA